MTDRLDIALLHRPGEKLRGGGGTTERFSIDFLVNGRSLFGQIKHGNLSGAFLSRKDELSQRVQTNASQKKQFTSFAADPLRVPIFVCPECGDLGCGAVTFDLAKEADKVTWSRFGYENNYDEAMSDFESYAGLGPFVFDAVQYFEVIERAARNEL